MLPLVKPYALDSQHQIPVKNPVASLAPNILQQISKLVPNPPYKASPAPNICNRSPASISLKVIPYNHLLYVFCNKHPLHQISATNPLHQFFCAEALVSSFKVSVKQSDFCRLNLISFHSLSPQETGQRKTLHLQNGKISPQ